MTDQAKSNKRSIQSVLIHRPMQREFTFVMLGIMMTAAFAVGMVINLTLGALTENAPITISRTTLERMIYDVNSQLVVSSILIIFLAVIASMPLPYFKFFLYLTSIKTNTLSSTVIRSISHHLEVQFLPTILKPLFLRKLLAICSPSLPNSLLFIKKTYYNLRISE